MAISGPPLDAPVCLRELLGAGLRRDPDAAALVSLDEQWSWRELEAVSSRLAANLLGLGLVPGDRAATLMPNRAALIIFYLACVKAGLVATPLNYRYRAPEIDHALEVSGAAVLLAHAERADDLAQSRLASSLRLGQIAFAAPANGRARFEELIADEPTVAELPDAPPSAPAFIYFTSGSTGKPKGVTHTQETFGWMLASAIHSLEIRPEDVFLPGSSLSHIGASLMSLCGLAAGIRVDLARTFDGHELLPILERARPTMLCMLPAALFALVRDHDATHEHFRTLRVCFAGGDKVSAELEREFSELTGIAIDEIYGMSEIGLASTNPPDSNRVGSIGKLAAGYHASIRGDRGADLPIGASGRLWIRSPATTIGYWTRPDATAEAIVDGWLDTGDVARVDGEGYLWFEGRKKQIIIHDGSNICPQEVEASIEEHAAVAAAGVVGVHDLVHGENVRAYVTIAAGAPRPTASELIRFSRDRVGYKAPEEIVFLAEMPLNATGKTDRAALKRLAESASG